MDDKKPKKPRTTMANVREGIILIVLGIILIITTVVSGLNLVFLLTGLVVMIFGALWAGYWYKKSKYIKETRI